MHLVEKHVVKSVLRGHKGRSFLKQNILTSGDGVYLCNS